MLGYFSGTAWNYVNDPEHWRVDLKTFEFVAYQSGTTIHFVRTDVPPGMKKPTDIVKAVGLVVGGTSVDNPKDIRLRLGLDMLGVPYHYVTGYRTSMPGAARAGARRDSHVLGIAAELSRGYRAESGEDRRGDPGLVRYRRCVDNAVASKTMEGLDIPSFPQLHKKLLGRPPSGQKWEAFRTIHEVNSTLQRLVVLPPGSPPVAIDALRAAVARLNGDPGVRGGSDQDDRVRA